MRRRYPAATLVSQDGAGGLRAFAAARGGRPPALAIFLLQPNSIGARLRDIAPAVFRSTYRIALAVWELPFFPPGWAAIDGVFNEYWTPPRFSADALAHGGDVFAGLAVMDLSTCPDRKYPSAHVEA